MRLRAFIISLRSLFFPFTVKETNHVVENLAALLTCEYKTCHAYASNSKGFSPQGSWNKFSKVPNAPVI